MTRTALLATLSVAMVLMVSGLWAINDHAGTNGFNFLKINYCPRAAALGGAYTGLADDGEGVFFNPAGLRQVKNLTLTTSYMNYIEDFQGGSVVLAIPHSEKLNWAVFAQYLSSPDIDKTIVNEQGNYLTKDGTFSSSDVLLGAGLGYKYNEILDLGMALKYLHEGIDDCSASVVAADIALEHQTSYPSLRIGVALRNLGFQTSYYTSDKYKEKMPTTLSAGFAYHPIDSFSADIDIYKPLNDDVSGRIGMEYRVHPNMQLRLGYNTNSSDWRTGGDAEALAGLSGGFGINWKKYHLDYAISSYGDLGMVNQLSLQYQFK